MTPAPPADSPVAPERPRRRSFSPIVTVLCSAVALLYIGLLGRPLVHPHESPLADLEYPQQSLQRLVTRELDLRAAMLDGGHAWEWALYRMLFGDDHSLAEASDWYGELLDWRETPLAQMERLVLLGEAGHADLVADELESWDAGGPRAQRFRAWVTAAYLGAPPTGQAADALIAQINRDLPRNWFADTLAQRIAARVGDEAARARAQRATVARGRVLLVRARALIAIVFALLALGVVGGVWLAAHRGRARISRAALPPIWNGADGYALVARALGAPQAIALVAFVLVHRETGLGSVLGMAADLPVFIWLALYLRARGSSIREAFGLVPERRALAPLAATTVVLIALALLADVAIQLATAPLEIGTHWTDGFSEDMIWADRRRVALGAIDAVLWAPLVEEVTFRGVLYGTLRTRLGVGASAIVSAVVFALPHGYAAAGSLSVLISGLLWAYAYERTRSLTPGILAHTANNALATVWTLALLR